jgi:hypothetical protein
MEANRRRNDKVKCVTLDTNILIHAFLKKIDIFTQLNELGFKIIIPLKVLEELKKLEKTLRGREKLAVKFALNLIERSCEIVEIDAIGADAALLATAEKYDCVLITNDRDLKRRAKVKGIAIGYLRMRRIEIAD